MTTAQESEELTRVGPGFLMGAFMRQYGIPAAMSFEVEAGSRPPGGAGVPPGHLGTLPL